MDAIKLDVEGAEDLILDPFFRDAPAALYPSLFLIEDGRDQWQIDLPKLLAENGYALPADCSTQTLELTERCFETEHEPGLRVGPCRAVIAA